MSVLTPRRMGEKERLTDTFWPGNISSLKKRELWMNALVLYYWFNLLLLHYMFPRRAWRWRQLLLSCLFHFESYYTTRPTAWKLLVLLQKLLPNFKYTFINHCASGILTLTSKFLETRPNFSFHVECLNIETRLNASQFFAHALQWRWLSQYSPKTDLSGNEQAGAFHSEHTTDKRNWEGIGEGNERFCCFGFNSLPRHL